MNAKNNLRLENFVHDWFSDLDELKPAKLFLERLDPDFEFDIYGTKLYGHSGFLSIYSGMQANKSSKARHMASVFQFEELEKGLFQINFHIALETQHPNGDKSLSESEEEWQVKEIDTKLIIQKYAII